MKLYEFPPTRSIRVRWTLQELGVPFDSVIVNMVVGENRTPAFLKLNPAGKLPVLVDGDLVLTESVAIVLYLAEKHPEKGFIPRDLADRARLYKWLMFAATELEQPIWRIARHTRLYPPERRLPAEVDLAREDFQKMAAIAEAHMTGREFVVGTTVTVADFVLAYTLDMADIARVLDPFTELRRYLAEMHRRPNAPPSIAAAFASLKSGG